MSSILSAQGVVLATAMVVSITVLYLAFSKQKPLSQLLKNQDSLSPNHKLRSCLCSEGKKKERKKKTVQFAENVKDTKGNGEEYRRDKVNFLLGKQENKEKRRESPRIDRGSCRNEIQETPANRVALYNGILRDRGHRIQCLY